MKWISDDLSLYTNKQFRSSDILLEVWSLIEDDLIYAMGIANRLLISLYIDNDSIILTCTSDYNVICSTRKSFNINHVLTVMTDLSVTLTIDLLLTEKKCVSYKKCSYYYESDNKEDDGSIEIECDANYNIDTYRDFKIEIISAITKELQFLIHRNILSSDINTCDIAYVDANFEVLRVYSNLKNISLQNSINKLISINKINNDIESKLYILLKRIENEKLR